MTGKNRIQSSSKESLPAAMQAVLSVCSGSTSGVLSGKKQDPSYEQNIADTIKELKDKNFDSVELMAKAGHRADIVELLGSLTNADILALIYDDSRREYMYHVATTGRQSFDDFLSRAMARDRERGQNTTQLTIADFLIDPEYSLGETYTLALIEVAARAAHYAMRTTRSPDGGIVYSIDHEKVDRPLVDPSSKDVNLQLDHWARKKVEARSRKLARHGPRVTGIPDAISAIIGSFSVPRRRSSRRRFTDAFPAQILKRQIGISADCLYGKLHGISSFVIQHYLADVISRGIVEDRQAGSYGVSAEGFLQLSSWASEDEDTFEAAIGGSFALGDVQRYLSLYYADSTIESNGTEHFLQELVRLGHLLTWQSVDPEGIGITLYTWERMLADRSKFAIAIKHKIYDDTAAGRTATQLTAYDVISDASVLSLRQSRIRNLINDAVADGLFTSVRTAHGVVYGVDHRTALVLLPTFIRDTAVVVSTTHPKMTSSDVKILTRMLQRVLHIDLAPRDIAKLLVCKDTGWYCMLSLVQHLGDVTSMEQLVTMIDRGLLRTGAISVEGDEGGTSMELAEISDTFIRSFHASGLLALSHCDRRDDSRIDRRIFVKLLASILQRKQYRDRKQDYAAKKTTMELMTLSEFLRAPELLSIPTQRIFDLIAEAVEGHFMTAHQDAAYTLDYPMFETSRKEDSLRKLHGDTSPVVCAARPRMKKSDAKTLAFTLQRAMNIDLPPKAIVELILHEDQSWYEAIMALHKLGDFIGMEDLVSLIERDIVRTGSVSEQFVESFHASGLLETAPWTSREYRRDEEGISAGPEVLLQAQDS